VSGLSTHVLDLASGRPAPEVAVRLLRRLDGALRMIAERRTDADGRARLLEDGDLELGGYRLTFAIGAYFEHAGASTDGPPFLDEVVVDFVVADAGRHHHVPLLVSPFGYTTYRGS
jgi:5-hydroxyisourate hydrolase